MSLFQQLGFAAALPEIALAILAMVLLLEGVMINSTTPSTIRGGAIAGLAAVAALVFCKSGTGAGPVPLPARLAFADLAANRVEIRMDVDNLRSQAVAGRVGFQLEGRLRQFAPGVDGQPRDIWMFSLLRDDFAGLPWAHVRA